MSPAYGAKVVPIQVKKKKKGVKNNANKKF